jgi:hypothetical protein
MVDATQATPIERPRSDSELRRMLRRWALFVGLGLLLYAGLALWAEARVRATGETNRFFQIWAAEPRTFDAVILGASHAMPLGYGGMEEEIEAATGRSLMNLSNEGAGVMVNALVLDRFLRSHEARHVVYVVDSFAFTADDWNEARVRDGSLLRRAPFDPLLVATLLDHPWAWGALPGYLSFVPKVNAALDLGPDRTEAELSRFDRTHRPSEQVDAQRIDYLFAPGEGEAALDRYLGELAALAERARAAGAAVTLLKMPTPPRYRDRLPFEPAFDARLAALARDTGARLVDHADRLPGDENYYDTDHLNRTGVTAYLGAGLLEVLGEPG